MNYLAHAFLSKNDEHLLVGNFIADHLRGNDFNAYPERVIEGIQLHRRIDTFTDAHPEFKKSKRIFYDGFEKYSGVLVDIYFDHLLAKNFLKHSQEELKPFAEKVYSVYTKHQNLIPASSSRFLDYVLKNNIYYSYADIHGIEKVLFHLSHRIKHGIQLNDSVTLFNTFENELQNNFELFFKDVMKEFY